MDSNHNFTELLNSQETLYPSFSLTPTMGLGPSQVPQFTQISEEIREETPERKERRKWMLIEDIVLCSAWLNTSKDAVVGNEQKQTAFWKRIGAYFNASPKLEGYQKRDPGHCKQRWQKINDQVCKFVGCYEAAKRQHSSGQNENDLFKLAYDIFFQDHKVKFNLEHAWIELRNDQKWCASTVKGDSSSKKRKVDDHYDSSNTVIESDEVQSRPEGVKAAKRKGKQCGKESGGDSLVKFQKFWSIKEKDLQMKERVSKVGLLESLIAKKDSLTEMEIALKDKLINDMLS